VKVGSDNGALDADAVLAFLDHVERDRGCSARSRNIRLAAIRSFFRLVALRVPDYLGQVTRVMAIPVKRCDKRLVGYLSRDVVKALLAAPNRTTWSGRRDHALLLTLYNSGARVSEIIALRREQVQLDAATGAHLELHGKGRKDRVVPLWAETARVLRAWFREQGDQDGDVAFPNARSRALSRDGVDHLLRRAVASAVAACPSLGAKKVSPQLAFAGFLILAGGYWARASRPGNGVPPDFLQQCATSLHRDPATRRTFCAVEVPGPGPFSSNYWVPRASS